MNPHMTREEKWIAYHLGELPEADRARVEAELKASPELAESYRRFVAAFGAWATEEVQPRPFDFAAFRAAQESRDAAGRSADVVAVPGVRGRKTSNFPGRLSWVLAAAAVLLFALSATRFTVTLGSTTLHWGTAEQSTPDPNREEVVALRSQVEQARSQLEATQSQLARLQGGMEQNTQILQAIAQRQIDTEKRFTEVTNRLSYYQQIEAMTRYRDTNALMAELASTQPKATP